MAGVTIAANALEITYVSATQDLGMSGTTSLSFNVGSNAESLAVTLGTSAQPGLVISNGSLQSPGRLGDCRLQRFDGLEVAFNQLTVNYDAASGDFTLDGSASISLASSNLSATFGDIASGGPDHGIVIQNGELHSLYIVANGGFSLYGLNLQATAVTIVYVAAQDQVALSGGVSVALTSKFAFAASIASSTPLVIDTQTGAFSIPHGLDIAGSLKIGTFLAAAVTVTYTPDGSSFDLGVSAQVTVSNEFTVSGVPLVNGQLNSIALSYSGGTGVHSANTGLYINSFSAAVDNITDPSQISISGSIGLYGIGSAKIDGNSFITATGSFFVDADELKITGSVSLVGGTLGSGSAVVDINWSTGVYSITAQLGLFDDIVNFSGTLIFDNEGDVTLSAEADVNVPGGVPYIGGQTLASLNFYLQVRPTMPDDDSFVAAWTTLPVIGGIGFEYDFADQLTITSGPPPQAVAAATPPETLTVSNGLGSGPGSLAAAIATANGYAGNTTIQFDDDVSTINLTSPLEITTSNSVTIVGPGSSQLTINGNGNQVFAIDGEANVSISTA